MNKHHIVATVLIVSSPFVLLGCVEGHHAQPAHHAEAATEHHDEHRAAPAHPPPYATRAGHWTWDTHRNDYIWVQDH